MAKNPTSEEGVIEVTATRLGKQKTETQKIKIRPFVTTPATVSVHKGTWFPSGDMSGVKVGVTITVPCYVEEIVPVFNQVSKLTDQLVAKEVASIRQGLEDD